MSPFSLIIFSANKLVLNNLEMCALKVLAVTHLGVVEKKKARGDLAGKAHLG